PTTVDWQWKGTLPPLHKDQALVWNLTVHKDWDAEAEVGVSLGFQLGKQEYWVQSNALRLDVGGAERCHPQPRRIEIQQPLAGKAKPGQPIPVQVVFTSVTTKPILFHLPFKSNKGDSKFVPYNLLFCYDAEGTFLPVPNPGLTHQFHTIALKPGQS